MDDDQAWNTLMARIRDVTGLSAREAAKVAFELGVDELTPAASIVDKAIELGLDVERKHAPRRAEAPVPEISLDAATVLEQIYWTMPRVLTHEMPRIGKAPTEAQELMPEIIDQLPEDVRAMLVKVNLLEGQATFWLRDEANEVDRPIGPIDITRYDSGDALHRAFEVLVGRLHVVLAADFN